MNKTNRIFNNKQSLSAVLFNLTCAFLLSGLLVSCASDGGGSAPAGSRAQIAQKIKTCKAGDTRIASSRQCMTDEAACYQVADGSWCTGARGVSCPSGSSQLPAGAACPKGARCFAISESLNCAIGFN